MAILSCWSVMEITRKQIRSLMEVSFSQIQTRCQIFFLNPFAISLLIPKILAKQCGMCTGEQVNLCINWWSFERPDQMSHRCIGNGDPINVQLCFKVFLWVSCLLFAGFYTCSCSVLCFVKFFNLSHTFYQHAGALEYINIKTGSLQNDRVSQL